MPAAVQQRLETSALLVSPMVRLELQYLFEVGRAAEPADKVMEGLAAAVGLTVCSLPFDSVISKALEEAWTRDPFDRLIVAHASIQETPLITKDETILQHYSKAMWETGG